MEPRHRRSASNAEFEEGSTGLEDPPVDLLADDHAADNHITEPRSNHPDFRETNNGGENLYRIGR